MLSEGGCQEAAVRRWVPQAPGGLRLSGGEAAAELPLGRGEMRDATGRRRACKAVLSLDFNV